MRSPHEVLVLVLHRIQAKESYRHVLARALEGDERPCDAALRERDGFRRRDPREAVRLLFWPEMRDLLLELAA